MENVPMGPPPPRNPAASPLPSPTPANDKPPPSIDQSCSDDPIVEVGAAQEEASPSTAADPEAEKTSRNNSPYSIPPWSQCPEHPFYMEVLKDGAIVDKLHVTSKGAYMFGRTESCDFILEHPSISRYHAVLQYANSGEVFIYDLGSTHGTFINKKQVKKKIYFGIHVGDIIRFGQSSRLYIFQGPPDLMPPEGDLTRIREKKHQEELQDREASLLRAKKEASLADGISWGMVEDAIEDSEENDGEEVTWQTFKGQLTERQEKTRGKIIKRMEKVANMRKEIDVIRAKDIAQGGLTQGQQTQIARNEQRTQQIMEELDSLEETLNESIRESMGARARKTLSATKNGDRQDADESTFSSDDDDFYDRTKRRPLLRQYNEKQPDQTVETADSLLDKKCIIIKEMEEKATMLQKEKSNISSRGVGRQEDDALDAYMIDLSSELATDTCMRIQDEISTLQRELDRIVYLLKIADPTGEAARKRDSRSFPLATREVNRYVDVKRKRTVEEKKAETLESDMKSVASEQNKRDLSKQEDTPEKAPDRPDDRQNTSGDVCEKVAYTVVKPQWLGAVRNVEPLDKQIDEVALHDGHDHFIDYKDRKIALAPANENHGEDDTSGLIIRKRKDRVEPEADLRPTDVGFSDTSSEIETRAEDAIALLLKHKRGYYAAEAELQTEIMSSQVGGDWMQKNSQAKRVLGPEKPDFLSTQDYESWVPPEGQSGDGWTSLNEKLGY